MKNIRAVHKFAWLVVALLLTCIVLIGCYNRPEIKENEWIKVSSMYLSNGNKLESSVIAEVAKQYYNVDTQEYSDLKVIHTFPDGQSGDRLTIHPDFVEDVLQLVGKENDVQYSSYFPMNGSEIVSKIEFSFIEVKLSTDAKFYNVRYSFIERKLISFVINGYGDRGDIFDYNIREVLFDFSKSETLDSTRIKTIESIGNINTSHINWY